MTETICIEPSRPAVGTDNARMLDALLEVAPNIAWNLDAALHVKANSRASDLRGLGWKIEWVQRPRAGAGRKRDHGYRLLNAPAQREVAA